MIFRMTSVTSGFDGAEVPALRASGRFGFRKPRPHGRGYFLPALRASGAVPRGSLPAAGYFGWWGGDFVAEGQPAVLAAELDVLHLPQAADGAAGGRGEAIEIELRREDGAQFLRQEFPQLGLFVGGQAGGHL